MQGDFSRDSFASRKHFAAVLKQQGRVDLDADWNEQSSIERHIDEHTTLDIVGPCGAPQDGGGFEIAYTETDSNPDLSISPGRIYVDGVLCEAEPDTTYNAQPDHPDAPALAPVVGQTDLVYLDVWRRHVTYVEDPYIREVALGGPDTTTRLQTVAQVKVLPNVGDLTCADDVPGWPPVPSAGRLTASTIEAGPPPDPCTLAAVGGYQGLENRFYRIEIHDAGDLGAATFKWSRDNGSIVYGIDEFIDGQPTTQLRLVNLGRDDVLKIHVGDWVEVLDDAVDLTTPGPGTLAQVVELDETERIATLDTAVSGFSMDRHPKLRRWDQGSAAIGVTNAVIELEDGITVSFSGSDFHSGDYWTFAARSTTGEIEVRSECPPDGIEHHYCRLAMVTWQQTDGAWDPEIHDCRNLFPPLTALTRFYYVGGSGQEAMPGQPLPELLRVAVMNGLQPVEGALVSFSADVANARVATTIAGLGSSTVSEIVTPTGQDGIAACAWQLQAEVTDRSQVLTATLLDASENPTDHPPIQFNANLSIASEVWYDSEGCINPDAPDNVQDALADLCGNVALRYVGGDGQEAPPNSDLPFPLHVRAANGHWPLAEAQVTFRVTHGGGQIDGGAGPANEVVVTTDADGSATATWRLGADGPQRVLVFLAGQEELGLWFNAALRLAEAGPRIRIEDVLVGAAGGQLQNDADLPVDVFATGIRLVCDRLPDPNAIVNKPICFVNLDLPYPMSPVDRDFWGAGTPFGFQAIAVAAEVRASENIVVWDPLAPARDWLLNRLFQRLNESELPPRVLARLTLQGNFVWSAEDPNVFVDGDTFGVPRDGRTGIARPTGDGRPGGDLRMWFWLTPRTGPALVAFDDFVATPVGAGLTINVLANDTGEGLTITGMTPPASGANATIARNTIVYQPLASFSGLDTLTYTITDATGASATATVRVNVVRIDVGVVERPPVVDIAVADDLVLDTVDVPVRGTGFAANEEVTVVAVAEDGTAVEIGRAAADPDGAFTADLVTDPVPEGTFTIRAVGDRGGISELGRNLTLRRGTP